MRFWNLPMVNERLSRSVEPAHENPRLDRVRFTYTHWKGKTYEYVINVESVEFIPYDHGGIRQALVPPRWVLHGWVITRDGEPRYHRRTFLLEGIKDIKVLVAMKART